MIHYRLMTFNTTAPSSPAVGEIWIKTIALSTYQFYIWINAWVPFTGGGTFITESTPDDNYINVVIQEAQPTFMKPGWIWIKESLGVAYFYIFDFVPLAGV